MVPGTRFVAFKVPLKPQLLQQVSPPDLTTCSPDLLAQVSREERRGWGVGDLQAACPALRLVIDLTNTNRCAGTWLVDMVDLVYLVDLVLMVHLVNTG